MNLWVLIALYVACSTMGLLFIKHGFNIQQIGGNTIWQVEGLFHLVKGGSFIIGFFLYVLGFFIWLYILSRQDLSLAFPIASGLLYLGLLFGSIFWLHEGISVTRIAGIFLILIGIILASRS